MTVTPGAHTEDLIAEALADAGRLTGAELAARVDRHRRNITTHTARMADRGTVEWERIDGTIQYSLTDEARVAPGGGEGQ